MCSPIGSSMDTFITNELSKFVMKHTGQDALSAIDEIVLSYMVGVLESLGSAESPEDAFNVDEFAEMMSAYIPSFTNINSSDICKWMFQLAEWLKKATEDGAEKKQSVEEAFFSLSRLVSPNSTSDGFSSPCSSASSSRSRSASQSEDEEKSSNHITAFPVMNQEVELLMEMFPHVAGLEIQQCYSMSEGDCEKAVQLILQRQDSGQQLSNTLVTASVPKQSSRKFTETILGDKKFREHILNRYGYIDQDDDAREHKPVAPKSEPKKLIRYRDNKIVSVKGERFSEIKTEENDSLKKPCSVLKSSRQYRFH